MKSPKRVLLIIVAFAIILPLLTLMIPIPPGWEGSPKTFRIANITTTLFTWLHIGAAWLFLLGIKDFKERLQRAYYAICGGLVGLGITQLKYPILSAFTLWYSPFITQYGGLSTPNLIASILMFLGIRYFAHIVMDKSFWTSFGILPVVLIFGITASIILPGIYRVETIGSFTYAALSIVNAIVILRIKRRLGPAYTNALAWFFMGLIATVASAVIVIVFDNLHLGRGPIFGIPIALAGIFFVKAGYAFNKIKEY